jgi:CheY-like chemotaxis protein
VLVGCRRHAGTLDIEVLDTGPGVPADQREKIFGEFVRLGDRDGRGQPGLGLGLAIVQRLCDLMALPIAFESALGRGSRFSVTLPRAPSEVGHHERPTEPALIIDTSAQPVVVVVEDDALVLEGMSGLLRSWGCHVVPFGSAKAALADVSLWEGSPPNLIIADYSLPEGKSGLELIATLRSAFGGEIAAFLISGDTSPDRIREVRSSGLHLLYKPVTPMALRAMLVRHLKMGGVSIAPDIRSQQLTV